MRKIKISAFALFLTLCSYASPDWKGRVLDENGAPLPFANVVLLSKTDSTVTAGTTTAEDGSFNIRTDSGEGLLMVTMIGYGTKCIDASDGAVISLAPDNLLLEGAVATAIMPKTRLTGEGLQTSVRGTVLENAGTARDVLGKTPGIINGQNGLEVIGKGAPLVYINGRKIADSSELERLQSNEIHSVEVITNPGPQYDASVRSVVRIRTVRRQGEGFGFNASVRDEQSLRRYFNDPVANVDMNYRIGDVDVFAGIFSGRSSSRQDSNINSETFGKPAYKDDGWVFNEYRQISVKTTAGVNWQIAANHSAGLKFIYGANTAMDQYQELGDKVLKDGRPFDETLTKGKYYNGATAPFMANANLYYNGQVEKLGIDFNFDWYRIFDSNFADIVESSSLLGKDSSIRTSSESDNNLYAAKLVFSYPVWKGMLQLGTEDTFSRRGDRYSITGTAIPPSSSKVREDNLAAFANYGIYIPKVGQISAGVRYEHVDYAYRELLGNGDLSRRYDNLYPSVSYANAFGPVQLMINYSEKTVRPGFAQLNNAIRYNSKYIIQSGNPALQPQVSHEAGLMVNWTWLTLAVDYSRTDNAIASWSYRYNDDGVMLVKPCNLEKPFRMLAAYLNATPTVGIWTLNYTAGIQNQWLVVDAPDPREASGIRSTSFSNHPIFFAQLFNTFTLKNDWQLELGAEVHTKGYMENAEITNNYLNVTAAVQKSFLRDKSLVLRLEGRDLAGLGNYDVHTDYGSRIINQTNVMDTQRLILSLRYRFNATQSKYKGTGAGQDVVNRMK